jgi:hypothetical protein
VNNPAREPRDSGFDAELRRGALSPQKDALDRQWERAIGGGDPGPTQAQRAEQRSDEERYLIFDE